MCQWKVVSLITLWKSLRRLTWLVNTYDGFYNITAGGYTVAKVLYHGDICSYAAYERYMSVLTERATPFTCIRIQRIERNACAPFSMFSSLSNVCVESGRLVVGQRTQIDSRANSSAAPSATSARNRFRRARMHHREYEVETCTLRRSAV